MSAKEAIDAGAVVLVEYLVEDTIENAKDIVELVIEAAEPLLARIITTVEELDELPIGSIVVDDLDTDWRKTSEGVEGDNWDSSGTYFTHTVDDIQLPAKLIHLGATK